MIILSKTNFHGLNMKGFFLLTLSFVLIQQSVPADNNLIFIIRVDDIQSRNMTYLPRSITDFEQMAESKGAKITWAVIPHRLIESQNTDGLLTEDLKRSIEKGHEVVMHGYNHICPLCGYSSHEMYCTTHQSHHSYETQFQLIADGLKILSDTLSISSNCFVPPGHHADSITYQVLLDQNFQWISTSVPTKQKIYKELYNLSPQNDYTWALTQSTYQSQLNKAIQDIKNQGMQDGYFCLLLHDPFIRQGYENGLVIQWIGALLDTLHMMFDDQIEFMTLSNAAEFFSEPGTAILRTEDCNKPRVFQIEQNYPNPFNSTSLFPYQLNEPAEVILSIFNPQGQLIHYNNYGIQNPGKHLIQWDGSKISSGLYFYNYTFKFSGDHRQVQTGCGRCLLIK